MSHNTETPTIGGANSTISIVEIVVVAGGLGISILFMVLWIRILLKLGRPNPQYIPKP